MKAVAKFFLYMGIITLLLYTSGCFYDVPNDEEKTQKEKPVTLQSDNRLTLAAAPGVSETIEIVLYFAGGNGKLVAERREIPKVEGIARKTINELCQGPLCEDLKPTLPPGTKLLDINIREGLCTVNFSKELILAHSGGVEQEKLTVYSIVNTLTQFSTVKEVQIWVDGKEVPTIAGYVDVSAPLARNDSFISALNI